MAEPSFIKKALTNADPTTFDLETVARVLTFMRGMLVMVAAITAILGLIMVGFQYFTAYGDESKASQAKKTLTWIMVGMVIIIFSEIIVYEAQRLVIDAGNVKNQELQQLTNPLLTP